MGCVRGNYGGALWGHLAVGGPNERRTQRPELGQRSELPCYEMSYITEGGSGMG